jgi:hypothetical protein
MTSAKKKTEDAISQLRAIGFDPSVPPADAVAKLASLRTDSNQIAVARALGQIVAPEAAAMLASMEVGTSGELRREIRRSLFRLRQHGADAPAIGETSTAAPQWDRLATDLAGMMSVADADGSRIVWMLKSRAGGGVRRLWALVSDHDGMVAVTADSLSRKELRSDRADLEQRAGAPMVDADWRLVDFIMCEAYRSTDDGRRARVGNFLSLRTEMVAEAPAVDFHHPVYEEFAAEKAGDPSPDLMKEADIAAYKLPQEAIKPFAGQMTELQQSTLVLNRMVQEERVNAILERAIEQLLTGESGYRLRRRLEDTAYYFARTGKRTQAGWAVAAAARLRDGVELKRTAFFHLYMRAQMGALLNQEQEKQQEQPRLIMTPAELMRARAAAQERTAGRGRLRS